MESTSTLAVALSQAILALTQPLLTTYPASTILALTRALHAALSTSFTPSWDPANPTRGSGRRCLSFSPSTAPPRPVHAACAAAGVSWTVWAGLLGNREFDMFVDPGRVAVRSAGSKEITAIWTDEYGVEARKAELEMEAEAEKCRAELKAAMAARVRRIIGDRLAVMEEIPDVSTQVQIRSPTVATLEDKAARVWPDAPIQLPCVPAVPTISVSIPTVSVPVLRTRHSRSSSVSSTGTDSSAFSFSSSRSADSLGSFTSATTVSSVESAPTKDTPPKPSTLFVPPHKRASFVAAAVKVSPATKVAPTNAVKMATSSSRPSRRERARMAKVTIDKTRDAMPYDMGRTMVLTGGVLLGPKRA
jgi:hypothetical protein